MSNKLDLAAIEARLEHYLKSYAEYRQCLQRKLVDDLPALVDEVKRVRIENTELKKCVASVPDRIAQLLEKAEGASKAAWETIDMLKEENASLKARVAELEGADIQDRLCNAKFEAVANLDYDEAVRIRTLQDDVKATLAKYKKVNPQ